MVRHIPQLIMQKLAGLVLSLVLVVLLSQCSTSHARRVDCTKFVFAPVCRGIAAKRANNVDYLPRNSPSYIQLQGTDSEDMSGYEPFYDAMTSEEGRRPAYNVLEEEEGEGGNRPMEEEKGHVRWSDILSHLAVSSERKQQPHNQSSRKQHLMKALQLLRKRTQI